MRILIATTMLFLILPKVAFQCLLAWYHQKKVTLYSREYVGKGAQPIEHRTLTVANVALNDIDTWFLYLKGKYDLVGPNPVETKAANKLNPKHRARFKVAPGIISPYEVKLRSGIAHHREDQLAIEFSENGTNLRRFQIFVIWCLQRLFISPSRKLRKPEKFKLMGVTISNFTMQDAVNRVAENLGRKPIQGHSSKFAFVNADCANKYHRDTGYKNTLNQFDNVFADGIGVKIAARWQGIAVTENVNGTDMFPFLCSKLAANDNSVYLLGASKSVVSKVAAKLKIEYPALRIAGFSDGFTYQTKPKEIHRLINKSDADLLLVAMGAPRQEQWIVENAPSLKVNGIMGVGGLFDFYSGTVSRAPVWLRELSLEWVWRLGAQPLDKGKRYLVGNPLFLVRAAMASRSKISLSPVTSEPRNELV
jgi:N-acetylglucosaminyldiphosphoundecaprenol N-acetyl-beta-D-mannosaminyltransferase